MMGAITINSGALKSALTSIMVPHLTRLGERVASRAKSKIRNRTGTLGSSIETRLIYRPEGPTMSVVATSPYSIPVHEGSQPHIIRPRSKGALHFFWENREGLETVVPARGGFRTHIGSGGILWIGKGSVTHPGHAPVPFLTQALEEVLRGG